MRRLPLMTLIGLTTTAAVAAVAMCGQDRPPPPTRTTCRQLADLPSAYAGTTVTVPTAGCQVEDGLLVWRAKSPGPADVIFLFRSNRAPDPLPPFVTGYCRAPVLGGPVRVLDCRPAE